MRITPIKTVDEVKKVYKLLKERYEEDSRETFLTPFPLSETYVEMINQVDSRKKLQFKAERTGHLIGFVSTADKSHNGNDIYIQAIAVKKEYIKSGVGRTLMKHVEQVIKRAGYKIIKIDERDGSNVFFIKSGYTPYLYVYTTEKNVVEKISSSLLKQMELMDVIENENGFCVKIDVFGEPVGKYKRYFNHLDPSIKSAFVYEKKI